MTTYAIVKLIHILAAVVALGFNLSYAVWAIKGKRNPDQICYSLEVISFMDKRIANPAYILSLLSGLLLSYLGNYNIMDTSWIRYSLILFGIMGIIGFGVYSPALTRQLKILKDEGVKSTTYQRAETKQTVVGATLVALALLIIILMVLKPQF